MGVKRIKAEGSKYRGKRDDVVVNWGSTAKRDWTDKVTVLNHPDLLTMNTNKLKFFQHYHETNVKQYLPKWTDSRKVAQGWSNDGADVVCRTKLTGSGGDGIVMTKAGAAIDDAPLYTIYCKKKDEYRVHFFGNEIKDAQRKARKHDVPDNKVNWQVRNHVNGFIYAREGLKLPNEVLKAAQTFVEVTDLDFGAIDLIYNAKEDCAYILEVNSAPGLEGQTAEVYAENLKILCHKV
jgi:glutathione synthase/RimK-type ligase-like ATP-grasp enzyme